MQLPKRRDWDDEDNQIEQETSASDGVASGVQVDAVAIGDHPIPDVGERPAGEDKRQKQRQEPCNQDNAGDDQDCQNLA